MDEHDDEELEDWLEDSPLPEHRWLLVVCLGSVLLMMVFVLWYFVAP